MREEEFLSWLISRPNTAEERVNKLKTGHSIGTVRVY